MARRVAMPYKDALRWLLDNDDTEFLVNDCDVDREVLSVSASLVADIYGRSDEEIRADLLKMRDAIG